jgi:hypothetical protein
MSLIEFWAATKAQWQAVMGNNPSEFKGDNRPVERVSWNDCVKFCQRLSEMTGKDFHLPSEAQWEYACRAGTTTPFYFGPTITTDLANYDGEYTYGSGPKGIYRGMKPPTLVAFRRMRLDSTICTERFGNGAPIVGMIITKAHRLMAVFGKKVLRTAAVWCFGAVLGQRTGVRPSG